MPPNSRAEAESAVIEAIRWLQNYNGYNPSFREVALRTGLPLGTVHSIAQHLSRCGMITYHPRVARSLAVCAPSD